MTIALKIAGVALALVLLSGGAALAQDDSPFDHDQPATHGDKGGDEPKDPPHTHGGPIVSDDTPIDKPGDEPKPEDKPQTDEPRDPPAEDDEPANDPTPDTPPTTHPIDPNTDDTPANDPTPEGNGDGGNQQCERQQDEDGVHVSGLLRPDAARGCCGRMSG